MRFFGLYLVFCVGLAVWGGNGPLVHLTFESLAIPGIEGDPALVPGPVGNVLEFDGRDDRIVLLEDVCEKLAGLETGTIAFWFRFEDLLSRQAILPIFYLGVDDPRSPITSS